MIPPTSMLRLRPLAKLLRNTLLTASLISGLATAPAARAGVTYDSSSSAWRAREIDALTLRWAYRQELAALRSYRFAPPPTAADLAALVRRGLPTPEIAHARAEYVRQRLERWSKDALVHAFLARLGPTPEARRSHAYAARQTLLTVARYGTWFGDPDNQTRVYGNANLQLIWFASNLVRAAAILRDEASRRGSGVAGVWTDAEQYAFVRWTQAIEGRYTNYQSFPAGLSNRKAAQIELMLRSAILRHDYRMIAPLLHQHLVNLLLAAIDDHGVIRQDSIRDKYHPQFFLASALQIIDTARRFGQTLQKSSPREHLALTRLAKAIAFAANENMSTRVPRELARIGDPKPAYDIPLWYLAVDFLRTYRYPQNNATAAMFARNYSSRVRMGIGMMWGFGAISRGWGL